MVVLGVVIGLVDLGKVRAGIVGLDGLDKVVVHPAHERFVLGREGRTLFDRGDVRLGRSGILFFCGGHMILCHIASSPLRKKAVQGGKIGTFVKLHLLALRRQAERERAVAAALDGEKSPLGKDLQAHRRA